MSLPTPPDPAGSSIQEDLGRLLNRPVKVVERIGGGRNSQVYRVETADGDRMALKIYFRHPSDKRDRLATEFGSFTYLQKNDFTEIPKPLLSDAGRGWALYEFIKGEKIARGCAGEPEVVAAANFLGRLWELSRKEDSRALGAASEACFAACQIIESVQVRLERLKAAAQDPKAPQEQLRAFLEDEFERLLLRAEAWSRDRLNEEGMSFDKEIDCTQRTLSPSDFGFHNALKQPNGRIIFLDFEYFGWDDPAKMISDFLLHPGMDFTTNAKKKFVSALFRHFKDLRGLKVRVESVYPLFGLKWCTILLNEFLPDQLQRRQFAATSPADILALQAEQLGKARSMLGRIEAEYEHFPYHD